ncbi:MAG: undecaprenyl/decaprenyl-phosphate alpha-N-acetylglucosaminyl 1-phosphate transferase [Oligoflexales bacterium]|nr:undecaprenyl/decaprenyl-phosphate alpha-N-acetylglucosaminyl 1-phosphate transferase [Oligoflexales bacterium]
MAGLISIISFTIASGITLFFIPMIIRFAGLYNLYDNPDSIKTTGSNVRAVELPRKVHKSPIPRIGGLGIVSGAVFVILGVSYFYRNGQIFKISLASLAIFILGFLDDLYSLPPKSRFYFQLIISSIGLWASHLWISKIAIFSFFSLTLPAPWGFLFSLFIVVGAINAINLMDGLDGLAGGLVIIGTALLSFQYFVLTQDIEVIAIFSIPIIGATLGFLKYNTFPATIFMGDGGSNWLGYMMGVLILIVLKSESYLGSFIFQGALGPGAVSVKTISIVSVLMCFAVPIFDSASVIFSRFLSGNSLVKADQRHFHHRLLRIGLSHKESVTAIYFIALVLGSSGLIPIVYPKYNLEWVPFLASTIFILWTPTGRKRAWKFYNEVSSIKRFLASERRVSGKINTFLRYWSNINRYIVYMLLVAPTFFVGVPPRVFGYAAVVGFGIMLISTIFRFGRDDFINSLMLSIGASILLMANNQNEMFVELMGQKYNIQLIYNGFFTFLFISTLSYIIVSMKRSYFLFTPSDFLLLMMPLLLFLVPDPYRRLYRIDTIGLRCLVLFMVFRFIAKRRYHTLFRIRFIIMATLLYTVLISLFGMRIVYLQ